MLRGKDVVARCIRVFCVHLLAYLRQKFLLASAGGTPRHAAASFVAANSRAAELCVSLRPLC
jgi:uncharacterized membrane protein